MKRLALLIFALALVPGCSRQPQTSLPDQASGWAKQGEARSFTAENLYEYIDGDAEKYVAAGVKQTLTADYKFQDKFDAIADVFIMGSADGARKVFEAQPEVGSKPVRLGDAGRVYSGSVTFRKGAYFVRLVAYNPQTGDALMELARAVEAKLKMN